MRPGGCLGCGLFRLFTGTGFAADGHAQLGQHSAGKFTRAAYGIGNGVLRRNCQPFGLAHAQIEVQVDRGELMADTIVQVACNAHALGVALRVGKFLCGGAQFGIGIFEVRAAPPHEVRDMPHAKDDANVAYLVAQVMRHAEKSEFR